MCTQALPRPLIMGVLNVTPDSFSDGGKFLNVSAAFSHARRMVREGADIIDIGGESSGPGSTYVSVQEELKRTIPVIRKLAALRPRPFISIDTYKAEVARQAIEAGAQMVNDVTALRGDRTLAPLIARTGVKIILMYSKDASARTTRARKRYKDVIKTISQFLAKRIAYAHAMGIKRNQIIIDPGMGAFVSGDPRYSFEILRRLGELKKFRLPILIGASRKSFLPGPLEDRLQPTLAAHMLAAYNGASLLRVHDVREHAACPL